MRALPLVRGRCCAYIGFVLVILSSAFLVAVALRPPSAKAQILAGVAFADDADRSVTWEDLTAGKALPLCNTNAQNASLVAVVEGFDFEQDGETVADDMVLAPLGLPPNNELAGGQCADVLLKAKAGATLDAGDYTGVVAVTAAGAGIARVKVTISGPEAVPEAAEVAGAVDTASLRGRKNTPWSTPSLLDGGTLPLKLPKKGQELAVGKDCTPPEEGEPWNEAKCPFIGNLYNESHIIHVYVAGQPELTTGAALLPLRITGDHNAGEYEGDLDPGGTGDEKKAVPLKLSVTDAVWCAIIAIFLGTLPIIGLQLWSGRHRPKQGLKIRRDDLLRAYAKAGERFHDKDDQGRKRRFQEVETPGDDKVGAYNTEVETAVEAYNKSILIWDTKSDAYKKLDESLKLAEDDAKYLGSPTGLADALQELTDELDAVAKLCKLHYPMPHPEPAMAVTAAALLTGALEVGEATKRGAKADAFSELLVQWQQMLKEVVRYEVWWAALNERQGQMTERDKAKLHRTRSTLREIRRELLEAADAKGLERIGTAKDLDAAYGRLMYLESTYEPPIDVARPGVGVGAEGEPTDEEAQQLTAEWKTQAADVRAEAAQAVEVARAKRIVGDILALLVSVAIAIATGLSLFYFGKNFGTTEDYITVIVVGAAAQVVAKAIMDQLAALWEASAAPTATKDPAEASIKLVVPA